MPDAYPSHQRAEARVAAQRVELGRRGDQDQGPVSLLERALEPLAGGVRLAETDVRERDPDRRGMAGLCALAKLAEQLARLVLLSRQAVDVGQDRHVVRGA